VNAVGAFAAVVEDVDATRGVMVCRSGFSQSAKTFVRNKGIGLYNLHDAESRPSWLELEKAVNVGAGQPLHAITC
jgi:hypothetical protein